MLFQLGGYDGVGWWQFKDHAIKHNRTKKKQNACY